MAVIDIVQANAAQDFLDADRPVVVDASLLCTLQIVVAAVLHPAQCRLMVVEANGANGTGRVTCLTGFGTRGVLTQEASAGLFINVYSFHLSNSFGKSHFILLQKYNLSLKRRREKEKNA